MREFKSYRDRYEEFAAKNARILAVSTDKEATQAAFRREIGAPFAFIADAKGELTRLYGVKTPIITFAKRYTFVIGKGCKVLHVDTGGSAIDTEGAMQACSLY